MTSNCHLRDLTGAPGHLPETPHRLVPVVVMVVVVMMPIMMVVLILLRPHYNLRL